MYDYSIGPRVLLCTSEMVRVITNQKNMHDQPGTPHRAQDEGSPSEMTRAVFSPAMKSNLEAIFQSSFVRSAFFTALKLDIDTVWTLLLICINMKL